MVECITGQKRKKAKSLESDFAQWLGVTWLQPRCKCLLKSSQLSKAGECFAHNSTPKKNYQTAEEKKKGEEEEEERERKQIIWKAKRHVMNVIVERQGAPVLIAIKLISFLFWQVIEEDFQRSHFLCVITVKRCKRTWLTICHTLNELISPSVHIHTHRVSWMQCR